MAIIKTAKYLLGANITPLTQEKKKTKNQGYSNLNEKLNSEGFAITKPNSYKLVNTAYGTRRSWPEGIKHIFLHHSANMQTRCINANPSSKGDLGGIEGMIAIFNSRGQASSHRGIDAMGNEEIILDDKYRAFCQGRKGMRPDPNRSGMSVELISMGYLIDTPITEPDGVYYQQKSSHGKKYWVKEEFTTLSVDFNGNPKPYRDWARWNSYTQVQVDATVRLIREWGTKYRIPFVFNQEAFNLMFPTEEQITSSWIKKIAQTPGVFSHNTVQAGKEDIYPDPLLVKTFKKEFAPGNSLDGIKPIQPGPLASNVTPVTPVNTTNSGS